MAGNGGVVGQGGAEGRCGDRLGVGVAAPVVGPGVGGRFVAVIAALLPDASDLSRAMDGEISALADRK